MKAILNTSTGKLTMVPTRDQYVEEDGKSSIDEDFSNDIEYFLFKPEALKTKNPKIYDWIQKTFGDKFKLGKGSRK